MSVVTLIRVSTIYVRKREREKVFKIGVTGVTALPLVLNIFNTKKKR